MKKLELYMKWEKSAESKLPITGDLSLPQSLVFRGKEEDYYQIGLDEENDLFFFLSDIEGVEKIESSADAEDLNRWLNQVNNY